jgi:hypothetical protein
MRCCSTGCLRLPVASRGWVKVNADKALQWEIIEMGDPESLPDINVGQLIEIICGYREETYPFEQYVCFLTFSTWLHTAADPELVHLARITAAGLVMLTIDKGGLAVSPSERQATIDAIAKRAFQPLDAADAIVNRCLYGFVRGLKTKTKCTMQPLSRPLCFVALSKCIQA